MAGNSHSPLGPFIITAYMPQEEWKKVPIPCTPGKTLQQALEEKMPELQFCPYCVYKFPVRSLLNPLRSCTSVNGNEITIELVENQPDPTDRRLRVVNDLQTTEDMYLSNIQLLLENYGDPLKKLWGLRGTSTPLSELFETLSNLRDVLLTFYTKVEVAVRHWDSSHSQIGLLFNQYSHMLIHYNLYYIKYPSAVRFLKQKKDSDQSFVTFIEQRRGAERHTLESLLLLPVSRIKEYAKLLQQLLDGTPEEHSDYPELKTASDKLNAVVQSREESLKLSENESKLEMVQARFHDHLALNEQMDLLHTPAMKRSKILSGSPSLTSKSARTKGSLKASSDLPTPVMDSSTGGAGQGAGSGKAVRMYVTEGPVTLSSVNLGSNSRYLFLFNDLLIVAKSASKSKTRQNLRLKDRVALVDIWVSENVKEMPALDDINLHTSFVIGWPTVNFIATFSTPDEKKTWFSNLQIHMLQQQQALELKALPIHVVNATDSNQCSVPDPLMVSCEEPASSVLKEALGLFNIIEDTSKFQLCVKSARDDNPIPLTGHEHPFSILLSHISQQLHGGGENSIQNAPVQFIVRRKQQLGDNFTDGTGRSKIKNLKKWYEKKKPSKPRGRKAGEPVESKMFGVPLETLMPTGVLPPVLKDILLRLYIDGPSYHGIFRKSANHAKKLQLKAAIEQGKMIDVSELPLSLVGSLLTEFLRNVPGSVFDSQRYIEFVATSDIEDPVRRTAVVIKIINRLPPCSQTVLSHLFPMLAAIAGNQAVNEMGPANLAICLAPTLLWPSTGFDVIRNEVPALIIFMIEHAGEIFDGRIPAYYRQDASQEGGGVMGGMMWDQDTPSGEHELSGYDELEPESEEGALSDSQAYPEMRLSPRKHGNRRYKWPMDPSFYKPDSETPECSDEDLKPREVVPPGVPLQGGHWPPAKPRMRVRTSESGKDRKERRRTIGGIIDGELLGSHMEESERLQNDIELLSNGPDSEYSLNNGLSYSDKSKERIIKSRRRPSRKKIDGSVNLGGLVGKQLVGSTEEVASTLNSRDAEEMFPSPLTGHSTHFNSGSDSQSSQESSSSLEQQLNARRIARVSSSEKQDTFKALAKGRRKRKPVRRSSSLKECGNHHWSSMRSEEDRKAQSFQNISVESNSSSSGQQENNHYNLSGLLSERNGLKSHSPQPPLSSEPRQLPAQVPSDDGLGSSINATPASTLSRDLPGKQPAYQRWLTSRNSGDSYTPTLESSTPTYSYHLPSTSLTVNQHIPTTIARVTSFSMKCSIEKPRIIHNYGLLTRPQDGVIILASAKYKSINHVEKPRKIYYNGGPEFFTDV